LVYTWDKNGYGMRGATGYLGYSYLETPGNPIDGLDNESDGIVDERRDSGPGQEILGQEAINNYVLSNYDLSKFEEFYGPLEKRPAHIEGVWWTGDEDMDWIAEFNDTGADGVFGTNDTGEKDNIPTNGEPNFDKTDIDESDQIGLTGFKMNRIRAGQGSPTTLVDNIVFFDDGKEWPKRLYNIFTDPDSSFDQVLVLNYNIGFLFASGPFTLAAGKTERFSLALGYGKDLRELRNTTKVVLQIYKANYQFAVPPPVPTLTAFSGDEYVTLIWDNTAERAYDPITNNNDFEGYRIYRSTDPAFLDPQVIITGTGTGPIGNGKPLAQFDLPNDIAGFSRTTVEGVAYFLGEDTGLKHTFTDTNVVNGQLYYYAVTAYDRGVDSIEIYPSENAISVSQTLRGGTILPKNVVEVIPNTYSAGYTPAAIFELTQIEGSGSGTVEINVLNSEAIPDDHLFQIEFENSEDSVRASSYIMIDMTASDTLFRFGGDLLGEGRGPVGKGILPIINTPNYVEIDSANIGFLLGSKTTLKYKVGYAPGLPLTLRRPGFPEDIQIEYSDAFIDTSKSAVGLPAKPTKFRVIAKTVSGDIKLPFRFKNDSNSGILSSVTDYIEILTATESDPTQLRATWRVELDTTGAVSNPVLPDDGDVYQFKLNIPYSSSDKFTFRTKSQYISSEKAKKDFDKQPYVVPNPYVGAASFEPQRFAISGRGERKIEFRNLPVNSIIRIYTINGELVKELRHDGVIQKGFIPWNLRNDDELEIAPGLYIYHIDGGSVGTFIGKFAIIK
jgi:hypothetical protein